MNILGHKEDWGNKGSFCPILKEFPAPSTLMVFYEVLLREPCKNALVRCSLRVNPSYQCTRKANKSQFRSLVHSKCFIKGYFLGCGQPSLQRHFAY